MIKKKFNQNRPILNKLKSRKKLNKFNKNQFK